MYLRQYIMHKNKTSINHYAFKNNKITENDIKQDILEFAYS